jgi:hypothetical protein
MRSRIFITVLFVTVFLFTFHQNAAAHGHTEVGDYELVIGFHNEPAYQGEPNGLDLFVTNQETSERVNGLEETLSVEIIYGSSKKELQIEPQFGQDGAYTAHVIPTETGDYTWHIFGMIEETPVDVSMTSSPDTFSPVESKALVSFPSSEASTGELVAQASSAASTAQTALIVSAIGVIIGLLGLVFGLLGYRAARRPTA